VKIGVAVKTLHNAQPPLRLLQPLNTAPFRSNPAGTRTTIYHFNYDGSNENHSYLERPILGIVKWPTDSPSPVEGRPALGNRRRANVSAGYRTVRNHSASVPRGLQARAQDPCPSCNRLRRWCLVYYHAARRSVKASLCMTSMATRSVAGDAARSSRRRQLHGGTAPEGIDRGGCADSQHFADPDHRRNASYASGALCRCDLLSRGTSQHTI